MVLAVAHEDVKSRRSWHEIKNCGGGGASRTPFLGSRENPGAPHATLNEPDPGLLSSAHFHRIDQFQVVVAGKGKLGRHELAPYCVHFARAYTPYGPLRSSAGDGLTFFAMRAHLDAGSQHLPKERDQLKQVRDRQPWQITRQIAFPTLVRDAAMPDAVLREVPGIKDDNGLAVYTLSVKPRARSYAPETACSDGQYLLVLKGSLLHEDKEYQAWSLLFVRPDEGPLPVTAGAHGLDALVLNFPRPRTTIAMRDKHEAVNTGLKRWQCQLCAFVYDEAAGLPEEGIPPGTRWQDVPESWSCPDCSASKADFAMAMLENLASP